MKIAGHDIAVCSWSLQPKSASELVAAVRQLGLEHVQLALGPLLELGEDGRRGELAVLRDGGIKFTGGMMAFPGEDYSTIEAIERTGGYRPDDHWEERLRLSREAAVLGGDLGLKGIGTHVGFVPAAGGPRYDVMIDRVRKVAAAFAEHGISLHMETGQERAASLVCFLGDVGADNVFVNFDPANMILYGAGDPIDAVRVLGKHVRHVHVKDATASAKPGEEWGEEVPFGTGAVDAAAFLKALADAGYTGPLAIEREAGAQRAADVKTAIETLRKVTPPAR